MTDTVPAPAPDAVDPFEPQDADLAEIFGFEMPEPSPAPAEPAPALVGAEEGEGGVPAAAAPPEPTPAAPATPAAPDDVQLQLTALQAQLADATARLADQAEQLAAKPAAPASPATDPNAPVPLAADQAMPEPGAATFTLPDVYKQALVEGDGEALVGVVEQLMAGLTTYVNKGLYAIDQRGLQRHALLQPTRPTPAADVAQEPAVQDQIKVMQEQYYEKFPDHRNPLFLALLQSVQGEMAKQFPGHPWTDNYIAALGTRVSERAKQLTALSKPATPAPSLQPGPRSAVPGPGDDDLSAEIVDILNPFD